MKILVTLTLVLHIPDYDDGANDDTSIMNAARAKLSSIADKYHGLGLSDREVIDDSEETE